MSATNWEDAHRVQTARIAELERENAELNATLDAIIAADERAVKLWRAAHPDNELVIPDRGKLVGWLLEQNDALRKALEDMPTCRCGLSTDEQCALSVENAVLRRDSVRLDWLTNSLGWIVVGNVNEADPSQHAKEGDTLADAWRAAIDAARKEAQP